MSKRKLLLADDSVTIQKVVNLTFAREGVEVLAVGDGTTALEKLAGFAPDVVLADVNMPGLNGYQLCEKIKQNTASKSIPVVLLVGSFEPYDEEEARRVKADDYLIKPFQSIRQLVNKVSAFFNSVDAEMIQTNKSENLPAAETQKADVKFFDEPLKEDFGQYQKTFDAGFKNLGEYKAPENFSARTQPLSVEEFSEFNLPINSSLEFEEINLPEVSQSETNFEVGGNNAEAHNFSPELVEAVAKKVVEKLSDKAIREIAREVVPQLAELIVRQLAEEKLKP